ncbi:MAG: MBL fold metallo-hydrolase [Thermodesulfobacterium sp.]|jgi:7,8-dihydropterin-6-yl-methyl-4-(beta-D-ribofuranosyl)aminobenzene 5'-phosphate synthase|nr:MBL fold metallo-hydrolase [Thermodesulfobacterium sp.]
MIVDLTVLFDNYPAEEGFETGWGYSCFIKKDEEGILFDTGADGQKLIKNIQKAEIKSDLISKIVISHAHEDHSGGLKEAAELNSQIEIYVGDSFYNEVKALLPYAKLKKVSSEPLEITKEVYLTGELGEKIKEVSLIINTKEGLIIITGCAHPGIENIIERATSIVKKNILALLGGLHLMYKNKKEILKLISYLKSKNVKYIASSHCTGELARKLFEENFGESFIKAGVGTHLSFKN